MKYDIMKGNMTRNKKTFHIIYLLGFFTSIAYALPLYILSSFLEQYADEKYVGLYITIATTLNLLAIFIFPQFIKKFTNFRTMLFILVANIINTFFLVTSNHPLTILIFFSVQQVTITLLGINLDVFLEDISDNRHAGKIRTTFLTVVNFAILLSPALMGALVGKSDRYTLAFIASAFMLSCVLSILLFFRKNLNDRVQYKRRHLIELIETLRRNSNLLKIFFLSFLLRFFFAIMVIYTPIYLHNHLGFSWEKIGVVLTIMLIPYVILELPAGYLADKYIGEKELMIVGMILMVIFTGAMAFIDSTNIVLWTGILFFTRVGAAFLESMQEVYFFKIVKKEDVDIINLFRDTHPAGWLLASVCSVVILKFFPIESLFLFLALVIVFHLYPALTLQDTK